ncbi:GntR family transcriptional regulator [Dactylosporangium sp. CA-152071]|uniref:GntR family transcriptional regulator n=1 Tax=Dactylosporangium sp. CA-152071 TaxID=3239933 RepID=UPI003D8A6169
MPIESGAPKYVEIINALQARIDRRTYSVGTLLPSEAQLVREFGASRSTVVRALEYLRLHGWVEGVQGKGRIVLDRPAPGLTSLPRRVRLLLDLDQGATLTGVARVGATGRIAAVLGCAAGAPLIARRHVLAVGGVPYGLSTVLVGEGIADGTELAATAPLSESLLSHMARRRDLAIDHVVERLGARMSTASEAASLQLDRRRCVAVALLAVVDTSGRPLLAVDAVLSRDVPELASVLPLT